MKPLNEQFNVDYVKQAKKLTEFKQLLSNILPIECLKHVEVANIRNQNLMLITDSPVWTTRLRQLSPQILDFIHKNAQKGKNLEIIHHVQISTRYLTAAETQSQDTKSIKQKPMPISQKTAELLSQSANSINDPQLRQALLRMAKQGNKESSDD